MLSTISEIIKERLMSKDSAKTVRIEYLMYSFIPEMKVLFVFLDNSFEPNFFIIWAKKDLGQKILSVNQELYLNLEEHIINPVLSCALGDQFLIIYKYISSLNFYQVKPRFRAKLIENCLELLLKISKICLSKSNDFWENEELRSDIRKDLDIFNAYNKDDLLLNRLKKDLEQMLEYLSFKHLRLIKLTQHGDYIFGNMRFKEGRIYLFDFESFGKINIPFYDFVTFFVTLSIMDSGVILNFKKSLYHGLYLDFIKKYSDLINVDQKIFSMLLPYLLIKFHNNLLELGLNYKTRGIINKIIKNYYAQ